MRRQENVVGFYKDKRGKARPITKSDAELNRKRVLQNPREFKGIQPDEVSLTQKLKRLHLELEKIGRKFDNVCDEKEAEALIELGEAKFREAEKIEKRLFGVSRSLKDPPTEESK